MKNNLLLAVTMALATWVCGWWGIAPVAVVAAYLLRSTRGAAWVVALAAVEGSAFLLLVDAVRGPLLTVSSTLGSVLKIPGAALLLITILFPALIAWSAAMCVRELVAMRGAAA